MICVAGRITRYLRRGGAALLLALLAYGGWFSGCLADDPDTRYDRKRHALIREIRQDVYDTWRYTGTRTLEDRVLEVMGQVPRHRFVPEALRDRAYQNLPLPIGYGQTISQPYIVALMTHLAAPGPDDVVLEIGTGSGYQAAVLSRLVRQVYSIEIIEPLGQRAGQTLHALGYANIEARIGDGYFGWPERAPFDAIVVTAAASHIPPPLVEQIRPGGVMVIPVGSRFQVQQLTLVSKSVDGEVKTRQLLPVTFVPLTGDH